MPNGKETGHEYVDKWCEERHAKLDERINRLENRIWWILGLLITQITTNAGAIIIVLSNIS